VTISARKSWNLPPEELLDAAYTPSLWRVQHANLLLLVLAVIGPLALDALLRASPNVHRRLAHPRRKRKPHICYPVRARS
jgi:hypothetical protein